MPGSGLRRVCGWVCAVRLVNAAGSVLPPPLLLPVLRGWVYLFRRDAAFAPHSAGLGLSILRLLFSSCLAWFTVVWFVLDVCALLFFVAVPLVGCGLRFTCACAERRAAVAGDLALLRGLPPARGVRAFMPCLPTTDYCITMRCGLNLDACRRFVVVRGFILLAR